MNAETGILANCLRLGVGLHDAERLKLWLV